MARKLTWGTPGRTEHYLRPRAKWALLVPSAVLGARSAEAPGIKFGHDSAQPGKFAGHLAEVARTKGLRTERTCGECHQRGPGQRDFSALSFDLHCASCHAKDGSLGAVDPVPQDDALPPD